MPRHIDTSGYILPVPVDDGTRICVKVVIPNQPAHRQAFIGAVSELTKAFNWASDTGHTAIAVANVWKAIFLDMMQQFYDNDCEGENMGCCYDTVQRRITPDGKMQININGSGWVDDPNDPRTTAVTFPPITLDAHHTKCDAASNVNEHLNDIIAGTSEQLGSAGSLIEIAIALVAIIFALFVAPESLPALVPLILPLVAGLLFLGQAAWDAYFDSTVHDLILCAIYCSIDDDGTFSAAGYARFLGKLRTNLPAGVARDMFMDLVSRVGLVGMNDYAAIGTSADADCSSCDCGCNVDNWTLYSNGGVPSGVIVDTGSDYLTVLAYHDVLTAGFWVAAITTNDSLTCCIAPDPSIEVISGTQNTGGVCRLCGETIPADLGSSWGHTSAGIATDPFNSVAFFSTLPFTIKIHLG